MTEVLHLSFESDFTDSSGQNNDFIAVGSASITTTRPILGTGSGLFTASGDLIQKFISNSDFEFLTNDFTIRQKFNLLNAANATLFYGVSNFSVASIYIEIVSTEIVCSYYGSATVIINTGIYVDNQVNYEVSLELYAGDLYVYVNGSQVETAALSESIPRLIRIEIGNNTNGRIDEVIIDNGTALADGASSYTVVTPFEYTPVYEYTDIVSLFSIDNTVEFNLNVIDPVDLNLRFPDTFESTDTVELAWIINDTVQTYLGHEYVDIVPLRLSINDSYSFEVYIPPNWVSRRFIARIGDLELPIASITASMSASGGSYLSLSIPSLGSALLDEIIARKTQQIIVTRQHIYSDGSTREREFIRVNYDTITSSQGGRSTSIVLTGRRTIPVAQSKTVTVEDIFFKSYSEGRQSIRLPIIDEIGLGDVVNGLTIGKINYYITPQEEYMECAEYIANGTDNVGAIGSNVRPIPLQNYLVVPANPNYYLWQEQGYLSNGRALNPADSTDYNYNLLYDSDGLLWYSEGFAVYEADGITQASINP